VALKKLLLAVLLFPPLLLGEEKFSISFQPFRDWKPKLTFESDTPSGRLKVEYKLFSTPEVKYKLFQSISAGFQIGGFSLPRLNVKIDRKVKYILSHLKGKAFNTKTPLGEKKPIICSSEGKDRFCPLKAEGGKAIVPIGRSFKSFTLLLTGEAGEKSCPLLALESFPSYPWLSVVKEQASLKIEVGETSLSVPLLGKRIVFALVKEGKTLKLFLPDRSFYTLTGPPVVYLYRAVLNKKCLKGWRFYLYPTAKGREEIFLTLFGE